MRPVTVPAAAALAAIARAWLGDPPPSPDGARLGTITLRPHQLRAVARIHRTLREFGGALLADAVGLGKTYVALAIARDTTRPLVVAPAALRTTWERAASAASVAVDFVSFETLSRDGAPDRVPNDGVARDLVIVDEAHHARNPATRRHRALAELAARARVLLLSATPVHNHRRDLASLLALFLGRRAADLDDDTLARLVVRRTPRDLVTATGAAAEDAPRLPVVRPTRWLRLPDAPDVTAALRAVPPPLPPRDGGTAGALWPVGLLLLWASSDGALRAALRRRIARAAALASALEQGRHLSRAALRRWAVDESTVQLELPLLVPEEHPEADPASLLAALQAHEHALRAALDALPADDPRDAARAALLRAIRRRHAGAPVLAFTHFADTARTLFRLLAPDGGIALLTGDGARVAGGTLPRHELVARFAPHASGVPPPRAADRVDLLLATDCLSEGLDLQDASVVVHLDIPWTPARLAQRVGRAARLGSPHAAVTVYGVAPPGGAASWLRLAARLRAKAAAARDALGPGTLRAGLAVRRERSRNTPAPSAAAVRRSIARTLERCTALAPAGHRAPLPSCPLVGALRAPVATYLALCLDRGRPVLLAGHRGRATVAARPVARAVRLVDAVARTPASCEPTVTPERLRRIVRELRRWARARAAARLAGRDADGGPSAMLGLRRAVVARAGALVGAAPPHERARVAARVAAVRVAAERPWSAGVERAVAALAPLPDGDWLPAVHDALRLPSSAPSGEAPVDPFRIVTIVVLGP